jgi:hypothetical protein
VEAYPRVASGQALEEWISEKEKVARSSTDVPRKELGESGRRETPKMEADSGVPGEALPGSSAGEETVEDGEEEGSETGRRWKDMTRAKKLGKSCGLYMQPTQFRLIVEGSEI